jgi:nucleoside-diphosphate-sugar epimerase
MRLLITGATGFVGGYVLEAARRKGALVAALVRPETDARPLEAAGVETIRWSPGDPGAMRCAVAEADAVVHCAAKIGDWGPHEDYLRANVDHLRPLLDACKGQALSRFVHISCLNVYEFRNHDGTDESVPIATRHRDGYSHSKALAEKLARQYYADFGVPVVVLRPGFIYGPRERVVLPRILQDLRQREVRYPGGGNRALNPIFVRNLVEAAFLALEREDAVGQVYNLTDGEVVTKRRFFGAIADAFELPHPTKQPPYWCAYGAAWLSEFFARRRGDTEAPKFCFSRLKLMGLNLGFSIEKARRELGYGPRVNFDDAMAETLSWYKTEP